MDVTDDVGVVFDGGQSDDELTDLRLLFPLFAITRIRTRGRTRERWYAHPVWSGDRREDLEAATKEDLAAQMSEAAGAYRVSLLTRGQDGWQEGTEGPWTS